ncbi:MAG: hypothetical protein ABFS14_00230 [Gemmatimonadota bacterium]
MTGATAWLVLSAILASGLTYWWYARREERVRGRAVAGLLRGTALFLVLGSPVFVGVVPDSNRIAETVWLVDQSRSMLLPLRPGGLTRADSALARLSGRGDAQVLLFGGNPSWTDIASLSPDSFSARGSLLAPALSAARGRGVDSVLVVTDGSFDDLQEATRLAAESGLGVLEVRVGEATPRIGVAGITLPPSARGGDTVIAVIEIAASGDREQLPTEVPVIVSHGDQPDVQALIPVPGHGRTGRGSLPLTFTSRADSAEWRRVDVRLAEGADPYGAALSASAWIQVWPRASGVVAVSLDPDWELRSLMPIASRASAGGATGYLQIGTGEFVRVSASPRPHVPLSAVRADIRAAKLLVVQGDPNRVPGWLQSAIRSHTRVLFLARQPGQIPGLGLSVGEALAGEWYVGEQIPGSPVAALLAGLDGSALPPLSTLLALETGNGWSPLVAQRDRRGPTRPIGQILETGNRRVGVIAGTGMWRWATRGAAARQAYRALYASMMGWLLEDEAGTPVTLLEVGEGGRDRIGWRIAAGVTELALTVRDSSGAAVWSDSSPALPGGGERTVDGPLLEPGAWSYRADGKTRGSSMASQRPFAIPTLAELLPRDRQEPLTLASQPLAGASPSRASERPWWPLAAAVLLLCLEWIWRRRIGLR